MWKQRFRGGLLLSLNKTIIHALVERSSGIIAIVMGEYGLLVESSGSVVWEQRRWQSGWWLFGGLAEQCCVETTAVACWRVVEWQRGRAVLYGSNEALSEQYRKKASGGQTKASVTFYGSDFLNS